MYAIHENMGKILNNLIRSVTKLKILRKNLWETIKKDYVV